MKKTLFIILSFIIMSTFAQNDEIFGDNSNASQTGDYKQSSGSNSFEVSFNPGNIFATGGNAFSLINGAVKYRHFSSYKNAFRFGANINFTTNTDIIQQENDDLDQKELKAHTTIYGITLMPGTEKHFDVSDRISPYVGFQALLGYQHTSYTEEYEDGDNIETIELINTSPINNGAGLGYFSFGGSVFTGVDYYFVKGFYVGVEVGFGLQYFSYQKSKYIDTGDSDNNEVFKNGSKIQLAPGLTTGNIRLGWTF